MNGKIQADELDTATAEFINTFNGFKKAAKKLMAVMDSIREKDFQELRGLPGEAQQSHELLIQVMDESGQIVDKSFGMQCVTVEDNGRCRLRN